MIEIYSDWLQLWPYAILMIVTASWALYHFLAPASWHDWAGAGLVQSFIIWLYAEMYGFPLTIYMLNQLPADRGPDGALRRPPLGHSVGVWQGRAVIEMAIGYAFVIAGLIMIIKGWIRVYYAGGRLVTDRFYGIVRHPQYTGIFLAIFGQIVYRPTILTLALSPAIVLAYVHLARWEERRLIAQLGPAFIEYQQHVPMFFPRWRTVRQLLAAS